MLLPISVREGPAVAARVVDEGYSQIVAPIVITANRHPAPRWAVVKRNRILSELGLSDDAVDGSFFKVRQNLKHPANALLQRAIRRPFAIGLIGNCRSVFQIAFNVRTRFGPTGRKQLLGIVEVVNRQSNVLRWLRHSVRRAASCD